MDQQAELPAQADNLTNATRNWQPGTMMLRDILDIERLS